jgi:hypothetical protein
MTAPDLRAFLLVGMRGQLRLTDGPRPLPCRIHLTAQSTSAQYMGMRHIAARHDEP